MRYTSELESLTVISTATLVMWVPYMLARVATRGLMGAFANPSPSLAREPVWAERAKLAHSNAIENLAVFAPIVLVAAAADVSTPATVMAAKVYVVARVAHYVVYAAGVPIARTAAFLTGVGATLWIAVAVLTKAAN